MRTMDFGLRSFAPWWRPFTAGLAWHSFSGLPESEAVVKLELEVKFVDGIPGGHKMKTLSVLIGLGLAIIPLSLWTFLDFFWFFR